MEYHSADKIARRYQQDIDDPFSGIQCAGGRKVKHIRYGMFEAADNERGDRGKDDQIFIERLFIIVRFEEIHRDINENSA